MKKGLLVISLISFMLFVKLCAEDIYTSIGYNGRARSFLLHIPPQYDGTEMPLLTALHFYGGTGEAMAATTELSVKADEEGFIAAYPDALGSPPRWDMDNDVGFISALIDTLSDWYSLDSFRIYVTGYSNGAFMAHVLAADLSTKIAACAPVAGGLMITYWWEFSLDREIPTIHFHARDDYAVPYDGSEYTAPVEEMMQSWAEENGCTEGPDSFWDANGALRQTWSNPDNEVENVLWTTDEGGHGWPRLTNANKLSANDLMWEFFTAHPMPEEEEPGINEIPLQDRLILNVDDVISDRGFIHYELDRACPVTIVLYDVAGNRIAGILNNRLEAGKHETVLDASDLPSGVYYCRMLIPGANRTAPVRVIK